MRFYGIALLASAAVLGACGGEKQPATDTAAANAAAASAATTPTPAATPGAPAGGTATAAPATGTTHEVKMVGDASGYKFVPENITIKAGDAIKWTMVSGGPHNVAFTGLTDVTISAQLDANMPATSTSGSKMGPLSGPLTMQPNETYTISFANIPAGKYTYTCTPHAAMNMNGSITIQ